MCETFIASCVIELGDSPGWLPDGAATPIVQVATVQLRITHTADCFFLSSESDNPNFRGGDTSHASLPDAMAQAEFQFGISPDGWQRVAA